MQFLLDNALAGVILACVALVLAYTQMSQQEAQVEIHRGYAARTQAILVAEVLKEDFANIGSGVPAGTEAIVTYEHDDGLTEAFAFRGKVNLHEAAAYETVRYTLANPTTIAVSRNGSTQNVTAYDLRRRENAGTATTIARYVTVFEILPQDSGGNATAADAASTFSIRFVAAVPDADDTYAEILRWHTRLRPVNVQP